MSAGSCQQRGSTVMPYGPVAPGVLGRRRQAPGFRENPELIVDAEMLCDPAHRRVRAAGHDGVTRSSGPTGEQGELAQRPDVGIPQLADVKVHGLVSGQLDSIQGGMELGCCGHVRFTPEQNPDTRGVGDSVDAQLARVGDLVGDRHVTSRS